MLTRENQPHRKFSLLLFEALKSFKNSTIDVLMKKIRPKRKIKTKELYNMLVVRDREQND